MIDCLLFFHSLHSDHPCGQRRPTHYIFSKAQEAEEGARNEADPVGFAEEEEKGDSLLL